MTLSAYKLAYKIIVTSLAFSATFYLLASSVFYAWFTIYVQGMSIAGYHDGDWDRIKLIIDTVYTGYWMIPVLFVLTVSIWCVCIIEKSQTLKRQ